jgi:predicted Zn-dependent protease
MSFISSRWRSLFLMCCNLYFFLHRQKGRLYVSHMSSSLQIRVIKQRAVKLSSSSSSSSVQKTVEKKSSIWKEYNKEF